MTDLINGRTPDEIKRILRWINFDCADHECDSCPNEDICSLQNGNEEVLAKNALDLIEHLEAERDAALAKVPKWIKLTEDNRPPDGYYNVMVKKRGIWQRDLLRYDADDDDWWKELSTHDEIVPGYLITHYMSLPEMPEEE